MKWYVKNSDLQQFRECGTLLSLVKGETYKTKKMKALGTVLLIIGVIGSILFGIQAANNSETFSVLGLDVAVSEANWTPVIVSMVVTVIGIIILIMKGKK